MGREKAAMHIRTAFAPIPPVFALFVSQQEPPWCFRFPGAEIARCDYYSLASCLIGASVIGGKCERYCAAPGQQQLQSAPNGKKPRQPR
jgi:hypothetical protein